MPRNSPYEIILDEGERRELQHRAGSFTLPYWVVMRAKMVLLASDGLSNGAIAEKLGTRREVVSRWRKRFFDRRLAGLEGVPGKGVRKLHRGTPQQRSHLQGGT